MREVASFDVLLKDAASLNLTPAFIDYDDPLSGASPSRNLSPLSGAMNR